MEPHYGIVLGAAAWERAAAALHLDEVAQNLRQSAFLRVCDKWRSAFNGRGVPTNGRVARRFVTEAIAFQYRSLQVHRNFFCVGQTFAAETILDLEIRQLLAPGIWTICLTEAGTGYLTDRRCEGEKLTAGSIVVIPAGFSGELGRAASSPRWRCLYLAFRPARLARLDLTFPSAAPTILSAIPTQSLATIRGALVELSTIECRCGDLDESLCFNLIENILIRLHRDAGNRHSVATRRLSVGGDQSVRWLNSFSPITMSPSRCPNSLSECTFRRAGSAPSSRAAMAWADPVA